MSTPKRKVIITFVSDNEIKLSGATVLVKDVITRTADEHGLTHRFDGNEKAWHVKGNAEAINDFINDFRKAVSDKVEVVVDMTKKLKAEEEEGGEEEEAEEVEKAEKKPAAKPESKPEVKPETKPAAKQELPTTPVPAITLVQQQEQRQAQQPQQAQQAQAQPQPQPQPQPQQQAKPEKAIDANKLLIAGLTIMNVGVEVMLMALMNNINSDEASRLMKHIADLLDEAKKILTT